MELEKKDEWIDEVTDELRNRLMVAARACVANGHRLLSDARILRKGGQSSTAVAIAVLAMEEAGKAFILHQAAFQRRWDSVLYKSLTAHSSKQGVAIGFEMLGKAMSAMEPLELGRFFAGDPDAVLDRLREMATPAIASGKKAQKRRDFDKVKQDALYVAIDRRAQISSSPAPNSESAGVEADEMIALAASVLSVCAMHDNQQGRSLAEDLAQRIDLFSRRT